MTIEQTRQLGIEFERRIQLMDPTTEFANKLDTETIYSILNEYQMKYVELMIMLATQPVEDNSKVNQSVLSKVLATITKTTTVDKFLSQNGESTEPPTVYIDYNIPSDMMYYINSYSVTNNGRTNNRLISYSDLSKFLENDLYNEGRIIRNPLCTLTEKTIRIVYDSYCGIEFDGDNDQWVGIPSVYVTYYKKPVYMDLFTSTACELPMECFEDLVSGAVDLYVATKYRLASNNQKKQSKDEE